MSRYVERLVDLLGRHPDDLEITILPTAVVAEKQQENLKRLEDVDIERMIVLEEGHLGIDARAFPFLIREVRRVYKELKFRTNTPEAVLTSMATSRVEEQLQLTACLLLFNPDHSTVWADRRRALLESPVEENIKWNGEIRFLNLLMTQHTKA